MVASGRYLMRTDWRTILSSLMIWRAKALLIVTLSWVCTPPLLSRQASFSA